MAKIKWETKEEKAQKMEKQAAEILKKENEIKELSKRIDDLGKRVKTLTDCSPLIYSAEKNYKNLLDKLNERK